MSSKCLGFYLLKNTDEKFLFDLSSFNYFFRSTIQNIIIASAKELNDRLQFNDRIDIPLSPDHNDIFLVGLKTLLGFCVILTTEQSSRDYLFCLAYKILSDGLKSTIAENFEYIKSIEKIKLIQTDLDVVKGLMIKNIEAVLKRGESIDELVKKSEYLKQDTIIWWDKTKSLNSCCFIL